MIAPADDGSRRTSEDFPELAVNVFAPMDGGIALTEDEIKGRNTWNLWCGGDEQFGDRMSRESHGLIGKRPPNGVAGPLQCARPTKRYGKIP
jgi:hypothetical protein